MSPNINIDVIFNNCLNRIRIFPRNLNIYSAYFHYTKAIKTISIPLRTCWCRMTNRKAVPYSFHREYVFLRLIYDKDISNDLSLIICVLI